MKEVDGRHIPIRTVQEFSIEIWNTLQELTSFYLIIYVLGGLFAIANPTITFIQYYIIKLTSFQSGVDAITSGTAGVLGLLIFTTYWINENWRYTAYLSSFVASVLGLLWLLVFYNLGGLLDPWFTIFIDLDQSFAAGLSQVLFSMAVIELAKPGQEATTYELLISIANASGILSRIISTQLLMTTNAIGCSRSVCPSDTVNISSREKYFKSAGPRRFTAFTLLSLTTNIVATIVFTQFLPRSKQECHEWNKQGAMQVNLKKYRGYISLFLAICVILYGVIAAILLLDSSTSCSIALGGSGCQSANSVE